MTIEPFIEIAKSVWLYQQLEKAKFLDLTNSVSYIGKSELTANFPKCWDSPLLRKAIEDHNIEYAQSSGTTSDRMTILRPKNWWQIEYARVSAFNTWLKQAREEKWSKAILTTAVCSSNVCYQTNPTFQERIINGTLYLNFSRDPSHWTRADVERMIHELNEFQPLYLDSDPIYLMLFTRLIERYELTQYVHRPKCISLSYEFCPQGCRSYLEKFWQTPIFQLFGSTETGYLLIECIEGYFHICTDRMNIECIQEGTENISHLVISSYNNPLMPLLRYRIGDLVYLQNKLNSCVCALGGIAWNLKLLGREKDAVRRKNSLITVGEIDQRLYQNFPYILLYDFRLSPDGDKLHLDYISEEGYSVNANTLKEAFTPLFPIKQVSISRKEVLPCSSSGKYLLVLG